MLQVATPAAPAPLQMILLSSGAWRGRVEMPAHLVVRYLKDSPAIHDPAGGIQLARVDAARHAWAPHRHSQGVVELRASHSFQAASTPAKSEGSPGSPVIASISSGLFRSLSTSSRVAAVPPCSYTKVRTAIDCG